MIRVGLADDHEIVRTGIKLVLENDPGIKVIWEASDGQEVLEKVDGQLPDVLVLDIRMPLKNGLEVTHELKGSQIPVKILMLTMHDDSEYILKSIEYGADGYILKDTNNAEFNKAVHTISKGQKYYSGDISNTIVEYYTQNAARNPSSSQTATAGTSQKDYGLTKREKQILQLIYEGVSNKEIAESLKKSIRTVETHRFNIMKKLEVNNITDLLKKIEREGTILN